MRRKRTGIRCRVKSAGRKPARLCFRQPAPVFSFFLAAAVLAGMSSHAAFSALGNEDVPEMSRGTQIMDRLSAEGGLMQDGRVWAGLEAGETEAETGIPGQEEEPSEDKADQPGWEAWQPVWEAWQPGREAWQPGQESEQPERETRQSGQETVQPYEGPGLSDQTDPGIDVGDELFMLLTDEMEPDTEEEEKWGPEDDGCLTIGIGGSQYPFAWIPEDAVYPDYTEYSGIDLDAAVQIAADLDMILQFRAYSSEREAMEALLAGEVDAVMGGILLERYENPRLLSGLVKQGSWGTDTDGIAFTEPYLSYQAVVLARQDEPSVTMPYPFALQGKKAGVLSLCGEDVWMSHYDLPGTEITVYSSDWDALHDLRYGLIDCIITGRRMASNLIRLQGGGSVQTGSRAIFLFEDHYAAAVRSEDESLRKKLSGAMESLRLKRRGAGIITEEILRRHADPNDLPRYPAYRYVSPAVRRYRLRKLVRTFSRKARNLLADGY